MTDMEDDQKTLTERTLKTDLNTSKAAEHRLVNFCLNVTNDEQYPKSIRTKAKQLLALRRRLQNLPESSPKEQQSKKKKLEALFKRLEKFHQQTQ